jgi:hypothetical protein
LTAEQVATGYHLNRILQDFVTNDTHQVRTQFLGLEPVLVETHVLQNEREREMDRTVDLE